MAVRAPILNLLWYFDAASTSRVSPARRSGLSPRLFSGIHPTRPTQTPELRVMATVTTFCRAKKRPADEPKEN